MKYFKHRLKYLVSPSIVTHEKISDQKYYFYNVYATFLLCILVTSRALAITDAVLQLTQVGPESNSSTGIPQDLSKNAVDKFDPSFANQVLNSLDKRILPNYTGKLQSIPTDWQSVFTLAMSNPDLRRLLFGIVDEAQKTLSISSNHYQRPTSLAQIPESILDPRSKNLGANQELFALAMADAGQADFLRSKVVDLAFVWRYLHQQEYLDKTLAILREVEKYRPLQRQGWSLTNSTWKLAVEGDGPFLATSWGITGIVDVMELLGDNIPADLRMSLRQILCSEIQEITRAWALKIPWYTKGDVDLVSNQWIDPNVAVIRGCLLLGEPNLLPAYNMATENLARSLSLGGADGAFFEGVTYAQMSLPDAFDALQRMSAAGDHRLDKLSFALNSWKWWVYMLLPGGRFVNCYDSRLGRQPEWSQRTPLSAMIKAMYASQNEDAPKTFRYLFPEGNATLDGIRYWVTINKESTPPQVLLPTYAYFSSQQILVWRSKFERSIDQPSAWALWARGGSLLDSHSQRDQGQVSIYCGNRVVLMECGTPDYSNPQMNTLYANAAGHSIMQVGELTPRNKVVYAPITVERLDADGGSIAIDTASAYTGVLSNKRLVSWARDGKVSIVDEVKFDHTVQAGTEIFRFHVGSSTAVNVQKINGKWVVSWDGVTMSLLCDVDISIEQMDWPDEVMTARSHRVVLLRSVKEIQSIQVEANIIINLSVTN